MNKLAKFAALPIAALLSVSVLSACSSDKKDEEKQSDVVAVVEEEGTVQSGPMSGDTVVEEDVVEQSN